MCQNWFDDRRPTPSHAPALTEAEIATLHAFGEERYFADGEVIFRERESTETFFLVLSGQIRVSRIVSGQELLLAMQKPGDFSGEITVLNGEASLVTGVAVGPVRVLHLTSQRLMDMIGVAPELVKLILAALARRVPAIIALQTEREKLVALGTLAAGFAHELNNPASAGVRAASQMGGALDQASEALFCLCKLRLPDETIAFLRSFAGELFARPAPTWSALDRSDEESSLADRLEELGLPDPWDAAMNLVDSGFSVSDVDLLSGRLDSETLLPATVWLANAMRVKSLRHDIENTSTRIAELVQSIKSYSYLDQAPVQETEIHAGLESTLRMLDHKLRAKSILVERDFSPSVPKITAYVGELNQIWTNVIDNAIGAMSLGGRLGIRTSPEGDGVRIDIQDNGSGIPADVLPRIFEPFFTTKRQGEGTGLGLDIAYKIVVEHHGGDIFVTSEPGKTLFVVRLPAKPK